MKLQLTHVSKRYQDKAAVLDVSLTLSPGVWGLLGANGAGKTTLMRMLVNNLSPSAGVITLDGTDIQRMGADYRRLLGYLPQDAGFGRDFTLKDYLAYMAALKAVPQRQTRREIDQLLDVLTLTEVKNKRIAKLSGGMKRRVGIAQALLGDPQIVIMDEPTAGLAPGERVRFRNLIAQLARDRLILISTHIVSDIEYLADRNIMMKAGQIVDVGTTDHLVRQIQGKVWEGLIPGRELPAYEMRLPIISQHSCADGQVAIRYLADQAAIDGSAAAVPRLEDLYLWLFPQAAKDEEATNDAAI